jgi:L-rhamnonate dehydratase
VERIAKVEALQFTMGSSWLIDNVVANPMSIFPQYRDRRSSWMGQLTTVIVRVTAASGSYGLGWVGGGKRAAATVVEDVFAGLLVGQDVFDREVLWERMYRASIPYGRKGVVIEALSGVDTALWDLQGKLLGQPVYALLGGKTRDKLSVYATGNDIDKHLQRGFRDVKLAVPFGPADGKEGMRGNEELVRRVRERMGEEADIMLDCYMGWSESYTLEMVRRLKDYRISWIEEPVAPEHYDTYRRLRDLLNPLGILVTGGEHEFTRWGFRELIEKRAVDILQPDVGRAGGVSEVRKICDLASAFGLPVILHGSGAPAYHLAASSVNCPRSEYIDMYAPGVVPYFVGEPQPQAGFVELSGGPGFGYELNPELMTGGSPLPIW